MRWIPFATFFYKLWLLSQYVEKKSFARLRSGQYKLITSAPGFWGNVWSLGNVTVKTWQIAGIVDECEFGY